MRLAFLTATLLCLAATARADDWQDPLGEVDWTPPFEPIGDEPDAVPDLPSTPADATFPSPAPADAGVSRVEGAPSGRAIAAVTPEACLAALRTAGVAFDALEADAAPGVTTPIRLRGAIDGIDVEARRPGGPQSILDCRLALALVDWAPTLRAAGVTRVEHYSCYRAHALIAGTATPSAHAAGLAIDAAIFYLDDGRILDVTRDWGDRARGADPCTPRASDGADARLLRTLVCDAAAHQTFEIVLTPHYDAAHANHVHLEVRPAVDWSYVH